MCTSVQQIEARCTRIRTSFGPTSGTGTSCNSNPSARWAFTTAGIVLLMAVKLGASPLRAKPPPSLLSTSTFRMVVAHARDGRSSHPQAGHEEADFHLPFREHDRALVSRTAHHLLGLRARVLWAHRGFWNADSLGVLRDARSQGPPE